MTAAPVPRFPCCVHCLGDCETPGHPEPCPDGCDQPGYDTTPDP